MKSFFSLASAVETLIQREKTLSPLPVSRKDFMLESTRGQPQETLPAIRERALKLPWVTVRHTMSLIGSISKWTADLSGASPGRPRTARGVLAACFPEL